MRPTTSLAGVVLLASICIIGAGAPPVGQLTGLNQSTNATAEPIRRVHTVGDVWMNIGSDGRMGTFDNANGAEPDSNTLIPVSFEFPGGSRREHLFGSGLWIGGIVGGVDTVVMAALFASSGSNPVFSPTEPLKTYYDSLRGHQYFVAHYADTALIGYREPANRSLGVEIRQTSHAFESPPYDRFVIVEYLIRNISRQAIQKVHVGFFADPDVFNELRSGQPENGPADDLTGFLRDRGIAYTIDNDGDAANVSDSLFSRNWCPSGFGLAPVMMDPLPSCTTFNWWATNFASVDWGPSRVPPPFGHVDDPALPYSITGMYRTMANSEVDYDQLEASIDKSADGWRKPAIAQADHIANGLDTRWTLAYCFGNLAPYDSLRVVMAYVVGDSIHTTPGRYPDPRNPDPFAAGLNLADLRRNVDLARWAWGHKFSLDGAAPARLTVTPISDNGIRCDWTPAPYPHATGYRLYRTNSGEQKWTLISILPVGSRMSVDRDLMIGSTYDYAVTSLDWSGHESPISNTATITAGLPPIVPGLSGRSTPLASGLNWSVTQPDISFAEYEYINIFRRYERNSLPVLYRRIPLESRRQARGISSGTSRFTDQLSMSSFDFVDDSVSPGVVYFYSASITNQLGLESPRSFPEVRIMPITKERKGLIIFHTLPYPITGKFVELDSLRNFYGQWAERHGFDTISPTPRSWYFIGWDYSKLSGALLSKYELIISVSEEGYGSLPGQFLSNVLADCMRSGIRTIFVARNYTNGGSLGTYPWRWLANDFLGIEQNRIESARENSDGIQKRPLFVQFIGGSAESPRYPELVGDSARSWSAFSKVVPGGLFDTAYGPGYIPAVGCLESLAPGTEVLYRYESALDTSIFHGKPIAVRRITDSSAAILFNFPLSLMNHEQAWQALTQAVADLGVDTTNYFTPPQSTTHTIVKWLYGNSSSTPNPAWDTNRDGVIDIRDVVETLQR